MIAASSLAAQTVSLGGAAGAVAALGGAGVAGVAPLLGGVGLAGAAGLGLMAMTDCTTPLCVAASGQCCILTMGTRGLVCPPSC